MAIKPDYRLIKVSNHKHWREDIQNVTTDIWTVYAFDMNTHVHCCELTPSYELHFIANDYSEIDDLTEEQREDLNEKILSAYDEQVCYMHVSDVDRMVARNPKLTRKVEVDEDGDDGDDEDIDKMLHAMDDIRELWSSGSVTF